MMARLSLRARVLAVAAGALLIVGVVLGVRAVISRPASGPPARALAAATSPAGVAAVFRDDGGYEVTFPALGFTFAGTLGTTPHGARRSRGTDGIGAFSSLNASYVADGADRTATIVLYDAGEVVRFTTEYGASPNTAPFPDFTETPDLPYTFGYRDSGFAPPTFSKPGVQGPLTAFDGSGDTYVMSAAANYMVAALTHSGRTISSGIDPAIKQLPAGFTHATLLTAGRGINATLDTWGRALRVMNGRGPVDPTATPMQKLGYWTDNGATYYYKHAPGQSYEQTLTALRDEFASKGVPLGYIQLDSWWYLKDPQDKGMYLYQADPNYLPDGLPAVQRALQLPLVTHARWLAPTSPYRAHYRVSGNVPISASYYTDVLATTASAGAVMYEQDWLERNAAPAETLADAPALLPAINQGATATGQTVQLCMATPRYFLEAGRSPAITNIRASTDRFERSRWDAFLYTSELAREAGLLPWSDVFMSSETDNLLLSTLSAGVLGVGDAEGQVDAANLLHSVRPDGVIVKPDAPLVPLDSTYIGEARAAAAQSPMPPMVAATRTDHGGGMVAAYVVAYSRGGGSAYSFTPADVGVSGDAYVYDWFSKRGRVVRAGQAYSGDTGSDVSYTVVVPIGRSGVAFLGDTEQFASLGTQRFSAVSDAGQLVASVRFARGERAATVAGWAPSQPALTINGSTVRTSWDAATGMFVASVSG